MNIHIDADALRDVLEKALNARKIPDPKTDIGHSFNEGIEVAFMTVDAYLVRLKSLSYLEGTKDD